MLWSTSSQGGNIFHRMGCSCQTLAIPQQQPSTTNQPPNHPTSPTTQPTTQPNQPTTQPPNQPNHPTTQPPHRFQQLIIKTYVGIPRFSAWTNFGACDPVTLQRWKTCVVRGGGVKEDDLRKALRLVGKKRAFSIFLYFLIFQYLTYLV